MSTSISFQPVATFPGWGLGAAFFKRLIQQYGCTRILEVGSGANPTIEPEYVRGRSLSYVTSDLSSEELQKADPVYDSLVLDISKSRISPELAGQFDLVFSRMVGEHVSDGRRFHENVYKLLRPGGISAHCLSTLWSLPFTANRLLPEFISDRLLKKIDPRDTYKHGKFPARYSWSRGPSKAMIRRFQKLGFEIVSYAGYFGHSYYQRRFPWLHRMEMLKARALVRWPLPLFCSYATIVLRKPQVAQEYAGSTRAA